MEEPRVKRPKISRGEDDYLPGNITEIELHNFMTFNHLVCKPGPRLNLVIGPNGSGKSSLVCAIALCLGGEPQLLGRGTSVGAYVQRGEAAGYIKISLRGYTKEEQIIVVRKIDTRNKSEWLYNGKLVNFKFSVLTINLEGYFNQERSVSTILYLVSLQDLTNCPFRVVDEINQGMDPINERKMFQQLVFPSYPKIATESRILQGL